MDEVKQVIILETKSFIMLVPFKACILLVVFIITAFMTTPGCITIVQQKGETQEQADSASNASNRIWADQSMKEIEASYKHKKQTSANSDVFIAGYKITKSKYATYLGFKIKNNSNTTIEYLHLHWKVYDNLGNQVHLKNEVGDAPEEIKPYKSKLIEWQLVPSSKCTHIMAGIDTIRFASDVIWDFTKFEKEVKLLK